MSGSEFPPRHGEGDRPQAGGGGSPPDAARGDSPLRQPSGLPPPRAGEELKLTYASYLSLDALLGAQHPRSDQHDELLFIVIHQTKELWLKQAIAELRQAKPLVRDGRLVEAYKSLARISRIQAVMTLSWDVLATMTPADYGRFRDALGTSSGFQSDQFRLFEFLLGLKAGGHVALQADRPEAQAALEAALAEPSLWDDANAALAAAGFALPAAVLERDRRETYRPDEAVETAWAEVYRDPERWWALYQLAEKLVDIDEALATWRFRHVMTVGRVIGGKRGTGGSSGMDYLAGTLTKRAFPELWSLRSRL